VTVDGNESAVAFVPGALLGPYQVAGLLGLGGMGEVYLAHDTRLGRSVALKCVKRRIGDDPVARGRALREAKAAARLTHPSIAHIYDVLDHDDGSIVIVMEYVAGRSLRDRLTDGPCTVDEALAFGVTIAAALEHAHAAGIVHCDIKPANIQLTAGSSLKILDFGIARSLVHPPEATTSTMDAAVAGGTPGYMAPEQALGLAVDGRTDIFSLGMVVFEMVTGERLSSLELQVGAANMRGTARADGSMARLPAPLQNVVAKALRLEPIERFQSATEFRTVLQEIQNTRRSGRWTGRVSPRRLAILITAGVSVTALTGVVWRVTHSSPTAVIAASAERWYSEGVNALQEGAYLQATRALERAVKADDSYALSWARLGEAQLELDQEPAARQSLLKASSLVSDRARLPVEQRLSLEGAMAMASRDRPTALRAYSDLAAAKPSSAPVFIDLGRVHETMNATNNAVESYERAARLDPDNPAAFLRLGVLQGRNQNVAAAEHAFARAEELYHARGRVEGEATVAYERGVMLDRFNRTADAVAALQKARQLAESVDSQYLRAAVAFKMSSVEGGRGNYAEAQKLAAEARTLSEPYAALNAFGLVDVGNISIYAGHPERADAIFREAIGKATRAGAPRAEARARLALAGLLVAGPRAADAVPEATAALKYYEQTGFASLQVRARTYLIRAQERSGDLAGAQSNYEALLAAAAAAGNESEIAQQHYSLAGVLLQRELYSPALQHCDESMARYRKLNSPYDVVFSSLRRADILWRLGRVDEADRELSNMFTPSSGMGQPTPGMGVSLSMEKALTLLGKGDTVHAARLAREGLTSTDELKPRVRAEFERILALALARSGHAGEAVGHLDAAQKATGTPDAAFAADIELARAEVELRLGHHRLVLDAGAALAKRFSAQGRYESAWMAARLAAGAAAALRLMPEADRWRAFADGERSQMVAQLDANARRWYDARADLRAVNSL
jgi:tetratricopeptide (TPR) repeat protein